MTILFGIVWLLVALLIALLINGNSVKGRLRYRIGFMLIALSFIGGFGLLLVILTAM